MSLRSMIVVCLLVLPVGCTASEQADKPGLLEGHLNIFSMKPVNPADADASKETAKNYAEYPLIILSQENENKEISQVTADGDGNYRVALPPGEYILDVQHRIRKHVRAKPQTFTVESGQTVRVDIDMDTGVR